MVGGLGHQVNAWDRCRHRNCKAPWQTNCTIHRVTFMHSLPCFNEQLGGFAQPLGVQFLQPRGDCFLLAPASTYALRDNPRTRTRSFCEAAPKNGSNVIHYGGGGVPTTIISGWFSFGQMVKADGFAPSSIQKLERRLKQCTRAYRIRGRWKHWPRQQVCLAQPLHLDLKNSLVKRHANI
jgi:hypothetical protein